MADLFPTFLRLSDRPVVMVGAGRVAATKLPPLIAAGARVTVIAPDVLPEIEAADVTLRRRPFEAADLDGAWFVVAAALPDVNRQVADAAEARRVFVNAVDDPASASAYAGAVVRRAGITFAISTDGEAPAIAGLVREGLDAILPDDLEQWMDVARAAKVDWRTSGVPMEERRPLLLAAINRRYRVGADREEHAGLPGTAGSANRADVVEAADPVDMDARGRQLAGAADRER